MLTWIAVLCAVLSSCLHLFADFTAMIAVTIPVLMPAFACLSVILGAGFIYLTSLSFYALSPPCFTGVLCIFTLLFKADIAGERRPVHRRNFYLSLFLLAICAPPPASPTSAVLRRLSYFGVLLVLPYAVRKVMTNELLKAAAPVSLSFGSLTFALETLILQLRSNGFEHSLPVYVGIAEVVAANLAHYELFVKTIPDFLTPEFVQLVLLGMLSVVGLMSIVNAGVSVDLSVCRWALFVASLLASIALAQTTYRIFPLQEIDRECRAGTKGLSERSVRIEVNSD
jgi:hypothetical protein